VDDRHAVEVITNTSDMAVREQGNPDPFRAFIKNTRRVVIKVRRVFSLKLVTQCCSLSWILFQ
jgi:hypothetical protein